jgi:hypothetical protein
MDILVGIENIGKFQFQTINGGPDEAKSQRRTTTKREELEKGCDTVAIGWLGRLGGNPLGLALFVGKFGL